MYNNYVAGANSATPKAIGRNNTGTYTGAKVTGTTNVGGLVGYAAADLYTIEGAVTSSYYYNNFVETNVKATNAAGVASMGIANRPNQHTQDKLTRFYVYKYAILQIGTSNEYAYKRANAPSGNGKDYLPADRYLDRAALSVAATYTNATTGIGLAGYATTNVNATVTGKYPVLNTTQNQARNTASNRPTRHKYTNDDIRRTRPTVDIWNDN